MTADPAYKTLRPAASSWQSASALVEYNWILALCIMLGPKHDVIGNCSIWASRETKQAGAYTVRAYSTARRNTMGTNQYRYAVLNKLSMCTTACSWFHRVKLARRELVLEAHPKTLAQSQKTVIFFFFKLKSS